MGLFARILRYFLDSKDVRANVPSNVRRISNPTMLISAGYSSAAARDLLLVHGILLDEHDEIVNSIDTPLESAVTFSIAESVEEKSEGSDKIDTEKKVIKHPFGFGKSIGINDDL